MTVTVFPYARSPYGKILLYTPNPSRVFTTAKGVQGKMDFSVPGGGLSSFVGRGKSAGGTADMSELGFTNLTLSVLNGQLMSWLRLVDCTYDRGCNET
jgi:hypothetical protein